MNLWAVGEIQEHGLQTEMNIKNIIPLYAAKE